MVVYRHAQMTLGIILPYHVLVQKLFQFFWFGQIAFVQFKIRRGCPVSTGQPAFGQDLRRALDALVANRTCEPVHQQTYFVGGPPAKTAFVATFVSHLFCSV